MKIDDTTEDILELEGTIDDAITEETALTVEIRIITMADIYENLENLSTHLIEQVQFAIVDINLDDLTQAKNVVSSAKGIITTLDSRRIALKKELLKPYDQIENKIKLIKDQIIATIRPLEKTISDAEASRLKERENLIRQLKYERFAQENVAMEAFLRKCNWLDNQKWYNKGYTTKKISEEIHDKCMLISSDLGALDILDDGNPHAAALALNYQQQGSLGKAIALRKQLQDVEKNNQLRISESKPMEIAEYCRIPTHVKMSNPLEIVHFRAELDRPKTIKLTGFMRSENIKFGIVKEENR